MKKTLKIKLVSFIIFALFSFNVTGQNIYAGKIYSGGDPYNIGSFSSVFGLYVSGYVCYLTIDSHMINCNDQLIVNGIEYFVGDSVVITGTTSTNRYALVGNAEYLEIEIATVEKLSSNRNIQNFIGNYEILVECIGAEKYKDNLIITEFDTNRDSDTNRVVDIKLYFSKPIDSAVFTPYNFDVFFASVLNNNSFISVFWDYGESPNSILFYYSVEGYKKNDSIFINYKRYSIFDKQFFVEKDCQCKGKKTTSQNIETAFEADKNKIYYDAVNQAIIIDEKLQNQFLELELYNTQGQIMLKSNFNNNSVTISNLPNGMYLCRLLQNGQLIFVNKIIKKN